VDPSHLKAELARLRKGRGVSRPDLLAVLGPTLRAILDVDDTTRDDEARSRFVSLVSGEAAGMPDDLGQLVTAAFGISDSQPLLHDRLVVVGQALQRDERTLRRRLTEADDLLADRMVLRFGARAGLAIPGWHWSSYRFEVDVAGASPIFLSTRTLVPSLDGLSEFEEIVSVPQVGDSESLHVEGVAGCTYLGRENLSGSSWRLLFALPRALAAGEQHETVVRFTWPGRAWIQPVAAFVPMRRVERFEVSVSFGQPRSCAKAWILDGVLPTSFADPPATDELVSDETVEAAFDDPLLGHAYGISWTWA
jgi:hypothetical protein